MYLEECGRRCREESSVCGFARTDPRWAESMFQQLIAALCARDQVKYYRVRYRSNKSRTAMRTVVRSSAAKWFTDIMVSSAGRMREKKKKETPPPSIDRASRTTAIIVNLSTTLRSFSTTVIFTVFWTSPVKSNRSPSFLSSRHHRRHTYVDNFNPAKKSDRANTSPTSFFSLTASVPIATNE